MAGQRSRGHYRCIDMFCLAHVSIKFFLNYCTFFQLVKIRRFDTNLYTFDSFAKKHTKRGDAGPAVLYGGQGQKASHSRHLCKTPKFQLSTVALSLLLRAT